LRGESNLKNGTSGAKISIRVLESSCVNVPEFGE